MFKDMATTKSPVGLTSFLLSRPYNNALIKSLHLPLSHSSSTAVQHSSSTGAMTADYHQQPHPSFKILGGARDRFLPYLPHLTRRYNPFPLITWNRHIETVFAACFRSHPNVKLRRECLRTQDGGSVALDWVSGDHRKLPPDSPLLILLPGLTGDSGDSYVRHMLVRARSKGWRVGVFNSRGCGNSPVTTPQLYSASFLGDMYEVVSHVSAKYPNANLYAVGWSIGANLLVRYLGQESHNCPLSGAVSLCNPFNLVVAEEDFRKGFNNIYDKALAKALSNMLKKNILLFEDIGEEYNIPLAANAKTLREFDDGLTHVSFGFKSVDDYYSNSNSSDYIKHVQKPLLCIQAANDPIAPIRGVPREDIEQNPNCLLVVTSKGGHLGWIAGDEAPLGAPWTDNLVINFLQYLEREAVNAPQTFNIPKDDDKEALHHLLA